MREQLHAIGISYWRSAILRAAIKLDLFRLLGEQALTCEQITRRLEADNTRRVGSFLEACTVLGLLTRDGDSYRNSELALTWLQPDRATYYGDLMIHLTNHWNTWAKLDELVVNGKAQLPFENGFVSEDRYWSDYMLGQHNRVLTGQGDNLARHVDLTRRHTLLDLGGGTGGYSIAICQAHPHVQVDLVDQTEPLQIARRLVKDAGLAQRITLIEADMHTVRLDKQYDAVLISGVVLLQSEAENRSIFQRAFEFLRPGGLIIIQDYLRLEYGDARHYLDTMMDLYVQLCFTPKAGDWRGTDIEVWMRDAGFTEIRKIPVPTHLAIMTAEKPVV
uniref:Ubiquinone/menaquinone biosynthesis C-methylase UbiE n=1 Tax=Candidatus Kentrum eta TaxID=2126337 RepID=A0A450UEF6_9GAMM|nr:MAG: Ubiquinone/menaquinone biosynthesis C-methylase UbiE [Candidatus Kentron sp. H]VFJ91891.1 MAG: Ubiquinone/menaquinone biosynthesis C-methylase UbiE [Candidatus Kentron sp. H]VFJ98547.1 MAG: Ubiquinone/menaquinone biosynthesis C-methylase UbiE [Candidatus Kentron sp. H]